MNAFGSKALQRAVVWLVTTAMLLPMLAGCVTVPPSTVRLDGIIIDGKRQARADETMYARVVRGGVALEARPGMELRSGDLVESGPRADLVIRYPSGSEVMMRPNSRGRIGSITDLIGEIFIKVNGLFSVETTFVKAGARGTAYLVRTGPGGATTVVVFEGNVVVDSPTGAWPALTLGPGSMAVAHPRAPQAMPANADELQRTRDWVEQVERLAPPATSVSKIAIGVGIAALVGAILAGRKKNPTPQTGSTPTNQDPASDRVK